MLVWFSINHPIIGVPNFDPYPSNKSIQKWLRKTSKRSSRRDVDNVEGLLHAERSLLDLQWQEEPSGLDWRHGFARCQGYKLPGIVAGLIWFTNPVSLHHRRRSHQFNHSACPARIVLWPLQNPKSRFSYIFTGLFKLVKPCKNDPPVLEHGRCSWRGSSVWLWSWWRLGKKALGPWPVRPVIIADWPESWGCWSYNWPMDPIGHQISAGHHCPTGAGWFHPQKKSKKEARCGNANDSQGLCLFSMPVFHVARWQWQWQMPPCLSWKNVSWRKPSDRMRRWRWLEKQPCSRCNQVDPAGNRGDLTWRNMIEPSRKRGHSWYCKWCLVDGYNGWWVLKLGVLTTTIKNGWIKQVPLVDGWWFMVVLNDHFERTCSVDFFPIHGRLRLWNVLSHELRPGQNHGNMFSARNGALVRWENHL